VRGPKPWFPGNSVQFTPDGGFVRYQRASGAWAAIAVTGGSPRSLPGDGVWARDGRYAYTRPLPPAQAGGQPRLEVEIGDRFGRKPRAAGLFTSDSHGVSRLTWSTDGSRLLYESLVRTARDLWTVAADGSDLQPLTSPGGPDSYEPAWSADGMRLAYTRAPFMDDMCGFCDLEASVVTSGADARVQSTVPGGAAGHASWAPSGAQLVVNTCCSSSGLDVVGVDGSGRLALAPGPAGRTAEAGAWSPDGTAIAYISRRGIELIAPDGSGRRLLLGTAATGLAWSHDGKLLAYSAPDGIYVLPADGSTPPRLVVTDHSPGRPSFSPDGSQLVYAAPRQEAGGAPQTDLFIASLQGGPVRSVAPSPYNDSDPAWRPLPAS
jgi:Tol biopolymer transport system component